MTKPIPSSPHAAQAQRQEHTPTPWYQGAIAGTEGTIFANGDGVIVEDVAEADAAHIVKCVNLHDELVKALELCIINAETAAKYVSESPKDAVTLKHAPHWPGIEAAREALTKAKGA